MSMPIWLMPRPTWAAYPPPVRPPRTGAVTPAAKVAVVPGASVSVLAEGTALALANVTDPAATVVAPWYVFGPESVRALPRLVTAPEPLMAPANVRPPAP